MVKSLPANAGDVRDRGFDPWVGKIPWRRAGSTTLVFLPENPTDRGAWRATVRGVAHGTRLSMHVGHSRLMRSLYQGLVTESSPDVARHRGPTPQLPASSPRTSLLPVSHPAHHRPLRALAWVPSSSLQDSHSPSCSQHDPKSSHTAGPRGPHQGPHCPSSPGQSLKTDSLVP